MQVVKDGEGITKLMTIHVEGAEDDGAARRIGLAIGNSPLVKTAIAGEDANWGRVVAAVGKAGEAANRDRLSIWFGNILVAHQGMRHPDYREEQGAAYMKEREIEIRVDAGTGGAGRATVWASDLTHGYIDINADYRS
jgi:glutamate N-acetyltransferase/amino-acid N-acetyltransferase